MACQIWLAGHNLLTHFSPLVPSILENSSGLYILKMSSNNMEFIILFLPY